MGGGPLRFHPLPPPFYLSAGDGCGHTVLAARSGTLSSRNYPGTYPNHTECRWQLRAPPDTSLILVFGDLDLEPSERCARSSLLLTDPDSGATYGTGGTTQVVPPRGGARMADLGSPGEGNGGNLAFCPVFVLKGVAEVVHRGCLGPSGV